MKLGLVELIRKPARFGVAGASLVLLTVLLLFFGGLLDGLFRGSTGLLRSQPAELVVFSSDARESLIRSRIDPGVRAQVEAVGGVQSASGLGVALVGGRVPGEEDLANLAVVGFEQPVASMPSDVALGPDEALADRSLEAAGVQVGQVIEVGAGRTSVRVVGWVTDTDFLQQGGFWVTPATWRAILGESRPDATLPDGTFQTLVVSTAPGADVAQVAADIDAAMGGATTTLTREEAVLALPGIKEQNSTFSSIIYVTLFVAGLVVALFFALLTLSEGSVVVGGQDISTYSAKQLTTFRRDAVGFVFQAVNLVPFLNARENLLVVNDFGTRRNHKEGKKRAERLLDELGLAARMDNLPGQLSGGERQRVAIGRALMNEPALILIDEPTSALDTKLGEQVMELIVSEVKGRSTAAVIVTHDPRMTHYADRSVAITDGRLAA